MANQRGTGVPISPFNPEGERDRALIPGIYPASQAAAAGIEVSETLSRQVGALADQLTAAEGRRAGLAAGSGSNYRPTDGFTIRDRAFDQAATETYLSTLSARFHSDALDLADKYRADPAGLKTAFDGLVTTYRKQHVFPEIDGAFTANATNVGTLMRKSALAAWHTKQDDTQRATLIGNMNARARDTQRVLALDPHDPVAEQTVMRLADEDMADIRTQVSSGAISAEAGEKLIIGRRAQAQVQLAAARASTLASADDVDAYRQHLRADFAAGKLPGLTDFDRLDEELARLSNSKRVAGNAAVKTLDDDLDQFLDRARAGTDGTADWAALEARGNSLGASGRAMVASARDRLALYRRLSVMPPDEAGRYLDALERNVRAGAGAPSTLRTHLVADLPPAAADNLAPGFQSSLAAMFQAMPPEIRDQVKIASGYRTHERQAQLWDEAVKKYGSPEAARKWVAPPGSSRHNAGLAADLRFDSETAKAWVHQSAGQFGLHFRLDNEDWHIEPKDAAAARAGAPGADAGVTASAAELLADGRKFAAARGQLIANDPLGAAVRDQLIPEIAAVDFTAGPEDLASRFRGRVAQADAVAGIYRRPPAYIRPDEKAVLQARLDKGGQEALDTVMGIVRGAGTRAPAALKEIGDGAPELAHAAVVALSTGDMQFSRSVAESLRMKAEPGARLPEIKSADIDSAWRGAIGPAFAGLDGDEEARTRAAGIAWTQREMMRRNIAPSNTEAMQKLLIEGFQKARGQTGGGQDAFGGVAKVTFWPGGLWGTRPVQVPASVRADKFGDVLDAITDNDLKSLPDPPMNTKGEVMTAFELRRLAPLYGDGGYRFAAIDFATGTFKPTITRSGVSFVLPWAELAPVLRTRVPAAFR